MARQPRVPGAEAPQPAAQPETTTDTPAHGGRPMTLGEIAAAEGGDAPVDPAKFDEPVDYSKLRAKDVDPYKIRRAVLTVDGWVCPAKLEAPKAKE